MGTGVIWGTIGVAGKLIARETDLDPVAVTWIRALIAAPVCLLLAQRSMGRRLFASSRRDLVLMAALGIVLIVYQYLYLAAVEELGVSIATLIALCVPPVLVALASAAFLNEPLTGRVIAALIGALAGTALLVGSGSQGGGSGSVALGVAFALGSASLLALHVLCSRVLAGRQHPLRPLAIAFPVGAVAFAPVVVGRGMSWDIPLQGWLLLLYLGVMPSAIAYWMYLRALRDVPASTASIVTLLEPLIAAILAWIIFGEVLGPAGWVGAALLIGAIAYLSLAPERPPEPAAEGMELSLYP